MVDPFPQNKNHEIILARQNVLESDVPLLTPPLERQLGSRPDIKMEDLHLRIGRRPFARNLRLMYKENNPFPLSDDMQIFISYDIWLLNHAVSIIKEGGYKTIRGFTYQVAFLEDFPVTVIDVLPQTRFVQRLGAGCQIKAAIDIYGHVFMPEVLQKLTNKEAPLSLDAKLMFSQQANFVGMLSFSVCTPIIQAIGACDNHSLWCFQKDKDPLLGDFQMMQIVLVPKEIKDLKCRARLTATVNTFNFLPCRLRSHWVDLECKLKD